MIKKPIITTYSPQHILAIPPQPIQLQTSASKTKVMGHIKSTFQRNPYKSNEFVAEQISSFIPQPTKNPTLRNSPTEKLKNSIYEEIFNFNPVEPIEPSQ